MKSNGIKSLSNDIKSLCIDIKSLRNDITSLKWVFGIVSSTYLVVIGIIVTFVTILYFDVKDLNNNVKDLESKFDKFLIIQAIDKTTTKDKQNQLLDLHSLIEKESADSTYAPKWNAEKEYETIANIFCDQEEHLFKNWIQDTSSFDWNFPLMVSKFAVDNSGDTIFRNIDAPPKFKGGKNILLDSLGLNIYGPNGMGEFYSSWLKSDLNSETNAQVWLIVGSDGSIREPRLRLKRTGKRPAPPRKIEGEKKSWVIIWPDGFSVYEDSIKFSKILKKYISKLPEVEPALKDGRAVATPYLLPIIIDTTQVIVDTDKLK
jgi:hypothetical protein